MLSKVCPNYCNSVWNFLDANGFIALGSMGIDMAQMVQRFSTGIEFSSKKDPHELDFGVVEIAFGKVSGF